jgi:hypothetical protein
MGTGKYMTGEICTHVNTFFTQNKPMNNHPKFGRYFMGYEYKSFMYKNHDEQEIPSPSLK